MLDLFIGTKLTIVLVAMVLVISIFFTQNNGQSYTEERGFVEHVYLNGSCFATRIF
jgi:hypothetical protein